jgi:hypothetical protein
MQNHTMSASQSWPHQGHNLCGTILPVHRTPVLPAFTYKPAHTTTHHTEHLITTEHVITRVPLTPAAPMPPPPPNTRSIQSRRNPSRKQQQDHLYLIHHLRERQAELHGIQLHRHCLGRRMALYTSCTAALGLLRNIQLHKHNSCTSTCATPCPHRDTAGLLLLLKFWSAIQAVS